MTAALAEQTIDASMSPAEGKDNRKVYFIAAELNIRNILQGHILADSAGEAEKLFCDQLENGCSTDICGDGIHFFEVSDQYFDSVEMVDLSVEPFDADNFDTTEDEVKAELIAAHEDRPEVKAKREAKRLKKQKAKTKSRLRTSEKPN
jgi:hypothetical protein